MALFRRCDQISVPELHRNGFYDADAGTGRDDAVEFEVGLFEEGAVLGLGALLAGSRGQHGDVEHLARMEGVAFGQDKLDDEEAAGGGHGAVAVGEDGEALLLAPVVDDVGHHVEVAAGRDALEEAARGEGDAIGHTAGSDEFDGGRLVERKIEKGATRTGLAGENGGKDMTSASADVGDIGVGREVVGGCDGGRIRDVVADEEVAEHGGFFGIAGRWSKKGTPKYLSKEDWPVWTE
jgi:hypothetical protein